MKKLDINQVVKELAHEVFGDDNFKIEEFDWRHVYITRNNEEYTIRTWNITQFEIDWTLFKMISNSDGTGHGEEQKEGTYKIKYPTKKSRSYEKRLLKETKNASPFVQAVLNLIGEMVVDHLHFSEEDSEITADVRFESDYANDITDFIQNGLREKGYNSEDIRFKFGNGHWMTVALQKS